MGAGCDPARFWTITPKEAEREMQGMSMRIEREADGRLWLAWHIVALDRTKKLPKLEKLLGAKSRRKVQAQTPEQHVAAMKAIFLAFGGDPEDLRTTE